MCVHIPLPPTYLEHPSSTFSSPLPSIQPSFSLLSHAGFVMLLQFLYQKGLMYRLVAMGQAHPMEVTGEGVRGRTYRGLFFLIPFLVVVYVSYQSTEKKELGGIVRTNAGSLVSFREVSDMVSFSFSSPLLFLLLHLLLLLPLTPFPLSSPPFLGCSYSSFKWPILEDSSTCTSFLQTGFVSTGRCVSVHVCQCMYGPTCAHPSLMC